MRVATGGPLITVAGDPRITRVGRLLRGTKLDELPQLWNVLLGEMSLVGPRPEVRHYVDRYTFEQRRLLALTPGITDPASLAFIDEENERRQKAAIPVIKVIGYDYLLEGKKPKTPVADALSEAVVGAVVPLVNAVHKRLGTSPP